jgi:hypothetical protein
MNRPELMAKMRPVRVARTLPVILSREEVSRLIDSARTLKHRTAPRCRWHMAHSWTGRGIARALESNALPPSIPLDPHVRKGIFARQILTRTDGALRKATVDHRNPVEETDVHLSRGHSIVMIRGPQALNRLGLVRGRSISPLSDEVIG